MSKIQNNIFIYKKHVFVACFFLCIVKDFNMKKLLIGVLVFIIGVLVCVGVSKKENKVDYLRLHIRANSNLAVDQEVKYKIKDSVVEFLTPHFSEIGSKAQAIEKVDDLSFEIKTKCESVLRQNGFYYSVNVKINNEYFPTRKYDNTTLKSGYYDAVIIELGEAKGDNWWCVMYPPLCFVNKNEKHTQIKFKSRINNWIKNIFD